MNSNTTGKILGRRGGIYYYVGQRGRAFSFARKTLHALATLAVVLNGLLIAAFIVDVAGLLDPMAIIESLGLAASKLLDSQAAMLCAFALAPLGGLGLAWKLHARWAAAEASIDLANVANLTAAVRAWSQNHSPFRLLGDDEANWERDASAPGNSLIIEALGQIEGWRATWVGAWILPNAAERQNAPLADQIARELTRAAKLRVEELGFDPFGYGLGGRDWNDPAYNWRRKNRSPDQN